MQRKTATMLHAIMAAGLCCWPAMVTAAEQVKRADDAKALKGLTHQEWMIEGVRREALIYAPPTGKTAPCPLVFAFHGHGGLIRITANAMGWQRLWPEAICVYMQGLPTPGVITDPEGKQLGWQSQLGQKNDRDLKFFDAVLATIKQEYMVDDKRIYCTGHSNGGAFTYFLWATRGDVFAAVAPIAAAAAVADRPIPDDLPVVARERAEGVRKTMRSIKPKPVLHVAGEKDLLVRFAWQNATIEGLRQLNGCGEGKPWGEHCTMYPSPSGTPVVAYIHPGRHEIPADAKTAIVNFFKEQVKP